MRKIRPEPNFAPVLHESLKIIRIAVGAAVTALSMSLACACGGHDEKASDSSLKGSISVSGAFALYPLAVQWANEFVAQHPGTDVSVSAGGAGKGMTDVLNGMTDFAMLSRDLHAEEREAGAESFVIGRDAVVPTFNPGNPLAAQIRRHGVSAADARKIWITGEYKTWGDLLGNGDRHKIAVYTRSDACGAAQTFAAWFGAAQDDLVGTAVYGDPGIAGAVAKDVWSMGFNNLAYAYDVTSGKPVEGVEPFPIDINSDGRITPEESFYATKDSFVKAIEAGDYPSPPARNLYFVSKGAPADSVAQAFIRYVYGEGQKLNEPNGYVRASEQAVADAMSILDGEHDRTRKKMDVTTQAGIAVLGCLALILCAAGAGAFRKTLNGRRIYRQKLSSVLMALLTTGSILLVVAMVAGLAMKSAPLLRDHGLWELLSSTQWKPSAGKFGFLPFICGTIDVTLLAILISFPLSLLTATYLTEYAPARTRRIVYPALDILASLPSVIYGVWGLLLLVPVFGYSLITGALVLAVMALPIMISLFVEIFASVPQEMRDASMALGATRWQTTGRVVLKKSLSGIFASVVLALSKCVGETIAVMMVCGSLAEIPNSIFSAFYTVPALIGNNYGEMSSIPLYESAIMFAALILLVIVLLFNILSRVILYRIQKSE